LNPNTVGDRVRPRVGSLLLKNFSHRSILPQYRISIIDLGGNNPTISHAKSRCAGRAFVDYPKGGYWCLLPEIEFQVLRQKEDSRVDQDFPLSTSRRTNPKEDHQANIRMFPMVQW